MLNSFIFATNAAAILLSGLVSCAPDTHSAAAYNPDAPKIVNARAARSLLAFSADARREIKIGDTLQFGEPAPARARVLSECRLAGEFYKNQAEFSGVPVVDVNAVLPEQVLVADFTKFPASCTMQLQLTDAKGAMHVFDIGTTEIKEADEAQVRVERVAPPENFKTHDYVEENLRDLRAFFHPTAPAKARLRCADFSTPELPFAQTLDLSYFDVAGAAKVSPRQVCRVILEEAPNRRAVSKLLPITFSEKRGKLEFMEVRHTQAEPVSDAEMVAFQSGKPVVFERWRFTNLSRTTHRLRIAAPATEVAVYHVAVGLLAVKMGEPNILEWRSGGRSDILVPALGTVTIELVSKFKAKCVSVAAVHINLKGPSIVTEMNDRDETIMEQPLAMPKQYFVYRQSVVPAMITAQTFQSTWGCDP